MKAIRYLLSLVAIGFLCTACNDGYRAGQKESARHLADSVSYTGLQGEDVKLVKTASLDFRVRDVESGVRSVSELARSYGGMIYDLDLQTRENDRNELPLSKDSLLVISSISPEAEIAVRVPSQYLEEFLYRVADLGYFTGASNLHVDDKSLIYLEQRLKAGARIAKLDTMNARTRFSASVQASDEAIALEVANRQIDADAAYSSVRLHLAQNTLIRREMIANYEVGDYELPFAQKLAHALSNGWSGFGAFMVLVCTLWPFLLSMALAYTAWRYVRKKTLA
jgi:hypothetical protein